MNLVDQIRQDAAGAALLADWVGRDGTPVSQEKANERAKVCLNGNFGCPCTLNVEPGWWEKVKSIVAETIKKQLSLKNRMKLEVPRESELNICKACGCCLRLAVWTPIERLKEHTTQEQLDNMPIFCWKKNELMHER